MQRPRKSSEGSACTRSPRRWHRRRAAHTGRLLVLLLAFWDLESVSSAVGHARSPGSADALACEALCGEPRVPAGKASAADLEWLAQKRRLGPGGGADGADGADGAESSSLVRVLKEKERRDHMDLLLVQRMFLEQLPFPGGHSLPSDFADFADAGGAAALEERFMRISPLTPSNLEQGDLFLLSEAVKAGDCWMFASAGFGLHLCWMFAIPDTGGPLNFDVDFYNASSRAAIDRFGTLKRLPSRLVHREIPKDDDLFLWGAAYGLDTEIQLIHVNKSGHVAAALPLFAPDSTERHEKRRLSDFGIGRLYLLRYFHPQTGDVVYEALSPLPGSLCLCSPPLSRNFAYDRDEGPTYTQQEQTPSGASSSAAGCKKSAKPPPQAAKPPSSSSKEEPRPAAAAAAASTSSPRPCPSGPAASASASAQPSASAAIAPPACAAPAPRPRPKSSPPIASSSAAPHPASAEDAGTDAIADAIKFPDCAALCGEPHIPASKASTADLEWLAQKRRLGPSGGGGGGRAEGIVSSLSEQQRSFHARQSSTKREHLGPEPLLLFSDFADEEGAPALRERFVRLDPAGLDLDWGVSDWWKTVDALAVADSWAFAEAGYHLNRTRLDDDDFYSTALRLKIELAPAFDRYPKSDLAASSGEDLRAVDLSPRALEESRFQAAATALDTEIQLILVDESGRVTALPPFAPNSTDREKRRRQLSDFGIGRLYVLRYYVLDPIADYLVYEALGLRAASGASGSCACSPPLPRNFALPTCSPRPLPSTLSTSKSPPAPTAAPTAAPPAAAAVSPTSAPLDLENSGQIPATQLSATQVATSPAAAAAASDHVQELWKTTSANSELADCAALCGEPRVPAGKASAADLAWLAQKRRLAMGPAPGSKADRKLKGVVKVASADELAAHKQVVLAHAGLEFVGPAPLSEFSDFADAKGADALRSRFKRIFPGLLDVKTDSWNLFLKALKVGEKWGFMEKGYSLDLARLDDALFYSTSVKRSMNEDLSPALMHGQISARANSRFWAAATALDTEIQLIHVDESGHVAALPPFSPNGTAAPDGHADGRRLSDFGIGRLFVLSYFHPELGAGDVFYEALSPLPGSPHACPCSPPLPRDFAYPQASAPVDVSATPAPEMRPAAVQPGPPTSTTYARAASSSAGVASGSPEAAAVDRPPHPSTSTATRAERGGDLEQATNADSASASDLEVEFPVDCSKKCRVPLIPARKASAKDLEWLAQTRGLGPGGKAKFKGVLTAPTQGELDTYRLRHVSYLQGSSAGPTTLPAFSEIADARGVDALHSYFMRLYPMDAAVEHKSLDTLTEAMRLILEAVEIADFWAWFEAGWFLDHEESGGAFEFYRTALLDALDRHVEKLPSRLFHQEIPSHANRLLWAAAYALDVEVQLILVDESGRVTALPPFAPNSTGTNTGAYPQREVTKIPERSLSDFGIGRLYVLRYVHPRTKRAMYEALAPLPAAGRLCACSPPLPRDFAYRQLPQLQTAPEKSKVASSKPASSSSSSTRAVQAPAAVQERAGQAPAAVQERAVQAPAAVQEPGASSAPVHGWPRAPRDVVTASAVLFACLASVPLFLQRRRRRLAPASAASAVEAHAAVAAATAAKALEASAVELGRELAAARSGEAAARAEAAEAQAEAREARRAAEAAGQRAARAERRAEQEAAGARAEAASLRAELKEARRAAREAAEHQKRQLEQARREGREAAAAAEKRATAAEKRAGEAEEALAAQRAAAERRLRGALGPVLEELEAGLVSLERAALPGLLRRLWPAIVAGARQRECAVCLGAVPEEHLRVLLPCLHASACGACVGRLPARQCPQCREPFERAARVFLADHAPAPGPA